MANPRVNVYEPIVADRPTAPPLVLTIGMPNATSVVGGVPMGTLRAERYVLLSALPSELRQRVEVAVQALLASA